MAGSVANSMCLEDPPTGVLKRVPAPNTPNRMVTGTYLWFKGKNLPAQTTR